MYSDSSKYVKYAAGYLTKYRHKIENAVRYEDVILNDLTKIRNAKRITVRE